MATSDAVKTLVNRYTENNDTEDLFADQNVIPENIDHIPADDTVSVYFRQMAIEPLLSAEQEVALARRIEQGQEAHALLEASEELSASEEAKLTEIVEDGQRAREHALCRRQRDRCADGETGRRSICGCPLWGDAARGFRGLSCLRNIGEFI